MKKNVSGIFRLMIVTWAAYFIASGLAAGQGTARGIIDKFVPVTQKDLNNPDPADWLMLGGNMEHWNYSPLNQINRENISGLQLVWARQLPTQGGRAGTSPLIHNGIMYLVSPNDAVIALDAVTGSRIWEYDRKMPAEGPAAIKHHYAGAKRGFALYGDRIFTVASDNAVVALDARTGKVIWETFRGRDGYVANTSGPIIANGILIAGGSCQNAPYGCYVTGHDITTGRAVVAQRGDSAPGPTGRRHVARNGFRKPLVHGHLGPDRVRPGAESGALRIERNLSGVGFRARGRRQECNLGRYRYAVGRAAGHRRGRVAPPTPAAGQLGPGMHV